MKIAKMCCYHSRRGVHEPQVVVYLRVLGGVLGSFAVGDLGGGHGAGAAEIRFGLEVQCWAQFAGDL